MNSIERKNEIKAEIKRLECRVDVAVDIHKAVSGQLNFLVTELEKKRAELVEVEFQNFIASPRPVNFQSIETVQ